MVGTLWTWRSCLRRSFCLGAETIEGSAAVLWAFTGLALLFVGYLCGYCCRACTSPSTSRVATHSPEPSTSIGIGVYFRWLLVSAPRGASIHGQRTPRTSSWQQSLAWTPPFNGQVWQMLWQFASAREVALMPGPDWATAVLALKV